MKTVFIHATEATDKAQDLREAARGQSFTTPRFEVDPERFSAIPKSPFAYWMSASLAQVFATVPPLLTDGRVARQGASSTTAFRYLRLSTEPLPRGRAHGFGGASRGDARWVSFAKGGKFAQYYSDLHLLTNWGQDGREVKEDIARWRESRGWGYAWSATLNGYTNYGRPGLTWTSRTQAGLSFRAMSRGCIFADKGPAIFVDTDSAQDLLCLLAAVNSAAFRSLVEFQMAFGSYEVGVIQRTPVPELAPADSSALASLAREAWSMRRNLDTGVEVSHAFVAPALLQVEAGPLAARAEAWAVHNIDVGAKLDTIQAEIDDLCYALYGISDEDRAAMERGFGAPAADAEPSDDEDAEDVDTEVDAGPMVASLLSWALGVGFGRFDVRLATGEREPPTEPEPFDPLPRCSPGMLTGDDGLPLEEPPPRYPIGFPTDGVLVDDPGHPRDLVAAARRVFDIVFPEDPDGRWQEAGELVGARRNDVRDWFSRTYFRQHLKRYSKSRRKAPIYWQLATPSASYSVWLYAHRLTRDSFFKVLNDYVTPKLQHEESKLTALVQAAGPNPSTSQGKAIAAQESFVQELRAFREEVERVAPLFHPNLDDGIVLVKAPLWRLVPHHKAWQKELKKKWKELQEGKYDWAHLAMHFWPERVVPKCAEDRSLAIAHDLEEVFWAEDQDGKWQKRDVDADTFAALVEQRTSAAVKDALQRLLDAPAPKGSSRRRKRRRA